MEYKKKCLNCGVEFTAKTRRALFHSDYCRVDFNRKDAQQKKELLDAQNKPIEPITLNPVTQAALEEWAEGQKRLRDDAIMNTGIPVERAGESPVDIATHNAEILRQIKQIENEGRPAYISTDLGIRNWKKGQQEKINELKAQLKKQ